MSRFDAIFTLNQDVLLEHHYVDEFDVSLETPRKWNGVIFPGMTPRWSAEPLFHRKTARALWEPKSTQDYNAYEQLQPIFKLHGSSNWISKKGKPLLVIGGKKERAIESNEILNYYRAEFQNRLCKPHSRLMIIGYGFRDHHINRILSDAVLKHDLVFSLICPEGRHAANTLDCSVHEGIPLMLNGYDLHGVFDRGLQIVSRRPLATTFGEDRAEYNRIMHFFDQPN